VVPAAIVLQFDPILRIGPVSVRLETLGLAIVILVVMLLAARIAMSERRRAALPGAPFTTSVLEDLRLDDLLFLVLGAVPGAVIGGRLDSVLAHADFYRAQPAAILDPSIGGLSLGLAVVGGLASAVYVGRLLEAPRGAWAHVVALPLLFGLAIGKLVLVLGGTGQGLPSELPWAMAYAGPGPWGSLGANVPSHPAQLYEAAATLAALILLAIAMAFGMFARRNGSALLAGLALWAAGRAVVASTWRDAPLVGPLNVEQLIAIGIVVGSIGTWLALRFGPGRRARLETIAAREGTPDWPDPATRPRF
jgi:phosphatidylglycerol:prolipoprotein diacylglycerol transferase